MKGKLVFLLLSILIMFPLVHAAGEVVEPPPQNPIDPNRAQVLEYEKMAPVEAPRTRGASASLNRINDNYFDQASWEVTVFSSEKTYQYLFQLSIYLESASNQDERELIASQGYLDTPVFTYQFAASGRYTLRCWAKDETGQTLYCYDTFTVQDDEHPTLEQKTADIVSECLSQCNPDNHFEIALWLHDWLIYNATYDYTYTHYGSDGVLLLGTGVCDSYSKAYRRLLESAGVPCQYFSGETPLGLHAWNTVKMDGNWYWVDVTWDDPNKGGYERHLYFGLPDEVMSQDHDISGASVACISYEDNYYIHTGKVTMWTDGFSTEIAEFLEDGWYAKDMNLPESYKTERGNYSNGDEFIVYNIAAYALNNDVWNVDNQALTFCVSYDANKALMKAIMRFQGAELILPPSTEIIEEEAFSGNESTLSITVPEGVYTIGSNAFSQCTGLWRVILPQTHVTIDASAFSYSPHVTISASPGGWAEEWAQENGLHFLPLQ